jgi:hypothetical protein
MAPSGFFQPATVHFPGQQKTPDGGNRRTFSTLFSGSTISRAGRPEA